MNTHKLILSILLSFSLIGTNPAHIVAQGTGQVNWLQGYISAVGRGYAKKTGNPIDADKAIAAARVVAQRELLETIKGVMVDNQTAVSDLMSERTETSTRVQGVLHNAVPVGDPRVKESEGFIVATLEMRICLYAESLECKTGLPLTEILRNRPETKFKKSASCGLLPNITSTQQILSKITYDTNAPLSMFVINLEGKPFVSDSKDFIIGFKAKDGEKCWIYSPEKVDPIIRRDRGTAEIFLRVSDATRKYSPNTITITAHEIEKNNYILIDEKDAYLLYIINEKEKNSIFKGAKIGIAVRD